MSNKESKKIRIKKQKKEKIKENERGEKEVKERKKEIFTNRGITLVALIITIIILLILAGVSLSFVFNGGILDKSQQAVNEYKDAASEEENELDKIDKYLEEKLKEIGGGLTEPEVPSVDGSGLATEDTTITTDDPNVQIVIPKGFAPVILETGRTDSMPSENGAVKEIMPAEEWNSITVDQINKGIVVVDNAITYDGGQPSGTVPDFNEYVWIPMPDSSKFVRVDWTTPYGYDENGSWGSGGRTHLLAESSTLNRWWEDKTTSEYTNMVDSVNRNKGFYISRYEASQKDATTAQSKRGQNPWVEVAQTTAITVSSNMKESINSHLIYGVEWDSILQWLLDSQATIGAETSGTRTITENDVQSDSRSWGNYYNSVGGAEADSGSRQPSGTNEYWKVNNIYDLAGNVYEWTQEKYSTGTYRAGRGGYCDDDGDFYPAAGRLSIDEGNTNYCDLRFQGRLLCVALYSGSDN